MKTTYKFFTNIIVFAVLIISTCQTFSQVKTYTSRSKFRPSAVTIDFLFGYSQPLPNAFGDISEFFTFKSYGVKNGISAQVNVKLGTNKKGTIKPYLTLGYNLLLGRDNSNAYIDSNIVNTIFPRPGNGRYDPVSGNSKMFLNNFNAGLGFEYNFVNKTRWTPFLGIELNSNVIFGTYRQQPNVAAGGNTNAEVSFTIKPAFRLGFGIGGGFNFRFHKIIGLNFTTKYQFANLLLKKSEATYGGFDLNKINLLDKSAPELNTNLNKDRQITFFEFLIGVSFYLGKK